MSLNSICRMCMDDSGNNMYSLYETAPLLGINYADMVMMCFGIELHRDSQISISICNSCRKKLDYAYKFKEQIERSDATIREILKYPNAEYIKEDIPELYEEPEGLFHTEINTDEEVTDKLTVKIETDDFQLTEEFLNEDITENDPDDVEEEKYSKSIEFISSINENVTNYVTCSQCNIKFKSDSELRNHKKLHMPTFSCRICDKTFKSAHGLAYHLKIHQGIKNYVCHYENCGRKFTLNQALQKHLSTHSSVKNHLCSLCGKTYSTNDALHYHLKTHRGERPYLCVHCGKTFKQSCHLKTHMWIHSGIKPHVCKTCGKCYTSGHQLKKHITKFCGNNEDVSNSEKHLAT